MSALLSSTLDAQLPSLTAALRAPRQAQAVALFSSSLLKVCEDEVQKGLTGSKALSAAALRAMGLLVRAVGDGDVLASVLPGLASGLVKVMLAAGSGYCLAGAKAEPQRVLLIAFQLLTTALTNDE